MNVILLDTGPINRQVQFDKLNQTLYQSSNHRYCHRNSFLVPVLWIERSPQSPADDLPGF